MKRKISFLTVLLIIFVLLGACTPAQTPTESASQPDVTAADETATNEPTATPDTRTEAEKLAAALSRPSPVVRLGALTVEQCGYDAAGDCYRCTVRVEAEAYVYAVANEDETEFTDFILKGEVK